jgi:hypothetical protein
MKVPRTLLLTTLPLLVALPTTRGETVVTSTNPRAIETALLHRAPTIRAGALRAALSAWDALHARGEISRPLLTVIDYGLPSTTRRLWVFDLASRRLLFHELVAHGRNSGGDLARSFSNETGSLMTSLGAFVTGTTYNGRNGYSLRLRGMEPGVNDRAEARTIVVHGAPYVCEEVARKLGRLGRSHGCPAIRPAIARTLIDEVKDRTLVYAWHPSMDRAAASAGAAATIALLGAPEGRSRTLRRGPGPEETVTLDHPVDLEEGAGIGQRAEGHRGPGEARDQPGGSNRHPEDLPLGVKTEVELVRGAEHPRHLLVELADVEAGRRQGGKE